MQHTLIRYFDLSIDFIIFRVNCLPKTHIRVFCVNNVLISLVVTRLINNVIINSFFFHKCILLCDYQIIRLSNYQIIRLCVLFHSLKKNKKIALVRALCEFTSTTRLSY